MNYAPKISPPEKFHSKSLHIQNVTIVNLCLVNRAFKLHANYDIA